MSSIILMAVVNFYNLTHSAPQLCDQSRRWRDSIQYPITNPSTPRYASPRGTSCATCLPWMLLSVHARPRRAPRGRVRPGLAGFHPVSSHQSPLTNHSPSQLPGTKALFLERQKRKFATPRWTSAVAGSFPGKVRRHIRRRAPGLTVPECKDGGYGGIVVVAISAAFRRLPHWYYSCG